MLSKQNMHRLMPSHDVFEGKFTELLHYEAHYQSYSSFMPAIISYVCFLYLPELVM